MNLVAIPAVFSCIFQASCVFSVGVTGCCAVESPRKDVELLEAVRVARKANLWRKSAAGVAKEIHGKCTVGC